MEENTLHRAHRSCLHNRARIYLGVRCGCFYCLSVFDGAAVVNWTDAGETAICPVCGVDSVLSSRDEDTSPLFLRAMKEEWFGAVSRWVD